MFAGHIGPWQQLIDAAVGVGVDQTAQHVGKVGVGLDSVELAGLDERGQHRPVLAAGVGPGEQSVLAV